MPYLQRNKQSLYKNRIFIVVGIFLVGSIVFSYSSTIFTRIMTPIWKGQSGIAYEFWSLTNFLRTKNSLIKENEALKLKVQSVEISLTEAKREYNKNNFGFASTTLAHGIIADILVRPPETPYDVLVLGAGNNRNIHTGDPVILLEGPRIGTITEVASITSKVRLYSASGEKTPAILERNAVPIELVGRGGGELSFTLPREITIQIGDRILDTSIKASLIGVVRDIQVTPTDSFKKVLVESVAPLNSLRFVQIVE
ncbi:hypothetical protein BH11PAT1_BH11PAT1_5900 [soil metagenome]